MKKITKLVLPVAGLGKRLLPLTKKTPKNLIPVNGKPLIEYALEDAAASGIKEVILVVNPAHREQFKQYLKKRAKRFPGLKFHLRVQHTPSGNGHALLPAFDLLKNEPFIVRFCDDIILSKEPLIKSLSSLFSRYKAPILLLERIPRKDVSRYGVVGIKSIKYQVSSIKRRKIYEITKIVEKPKTNQAPSNLIIVGGYVLTPSVLRNIKQVADSLPIVAEDALPLAVGLQIELIIGRKVYGWEFDGKRLDCGTLDNLGKTEEALKLPR